MSVNIKLLKAVVFILVVIVFLNATDESSAKLLTKKDLTQCPECKKHFMEKYALYDHMRFQCTKKTREKNALVKAGVQMYIGTIQ